MTRRLYYTDSYRTDFEARVVEVLPWSGGGCQVRLDETCFYPTSGGQMHDRGELGGIRVVDVREVDDEIWHFLDDAPAFSVDDLVVGSIDAQRRADHRQQHTGQHILSRVLEETYSLATESSRLGESGNTLDVAGTRLSLGDLDQIERRCHEIFWQSHPVRVHLYSPEEAATRGLRQKVERSGPVRVIEIEGIDRCACGGTHVANTAEIGVIALSSLEKVRGGQRIHFLCGRRAEERRREAYRTLHALAADLTTGTDQLAEGVRKLKAEAKEGQRRCQQLASQLVRARSRDWGLEAKDASFGGRAFRWVHRELDGDESLAAGEALRALTSTSGTLATLCLEQGGRLHLLVSRAEDLDVDCRVLLEEVLGPLGGRGGGRPEQARGGVSEGSGGLIREALESCLRGGAAPTPG